MKRVGFTLIELLIVVVLIILLSGMIMLSSSESMTSARAANIISNLENIRTATTAWYIDNRDKILIDSSVKINGIVKPVRQWNGSKLEIYEYLSGGEKIYINETEDGTLKPGSYGIFESGEKNLCWYVGYYFKNNESSIKNKIKLRKESLKIFFTSEAEPLKILKDNEQEHEHERIVWMKILEF